MAKRTNKTNHVLNLLSGSEEKKESKKVQDTSSHPPVDLESSVSVIDPVDEEAELADKIRKSLETELENEADSFNEEKTKEDVAELEEEEAGSSEPELEEEEAGSSEPELEEEDAPNAQEECNDEEFANSFVFVNVMERLVEEKVVNYMEQFGVCTCSHCKSDVMALALTKLPPKYVVVNMAAVSPLINFYSNKYAGQITVEITKACIRVNETPHHNRD